MIKEMKKREGCLFIQNAMAGLLLFVGVLLWVSPMACMTVEAEGSVIDSVEATVTQPVGWAKVSSITATPGNSTYQAIVKVIHQWNGKDFAPTTPGGEFEAGVKYRIVVKFTPNPGYTFSDSYTASINGNAASRYTTNDGTLCFAYIVTALPINSKETCIEVNSIAVKSDAQNPVIGAAVTNPSCEVVSNSAIMMQETGWVNADTGIHGSGVFTAGNWSCYFLLRLEGDAYTKYKFASKENMTFTVNGVKGQVTEITNGTDYALVRAVSNPMAAVAEGTTPETDPEKTPEKGTELQDASDTAVYKVTTEGKTVEYSKPSSQSVGTVIIPETITIDGVTYKVTKIADNAFKNNKTITKVVIGNNITAIGNSAFYGASKLKSVTIGANVTSIGDKAFYKCTALTKIVIPAKVNKIGKMAFYGCKNLKNITIKTKKLTTKKVGSKAFKGIYKKAVIKVPKSKLKAYKTMLKKRGIGKSVKVKK